ncbi:hypothetical protein ACVWZN_001615 [Lysobacter sp. HA35]
MPTTSADVEALVARELERIAQPDLVTRIRELLVPVHCERVGWDYGDPEQTYPCWVVAYDPETSLAFPYSEHGFGPEYPWGMFWRGPRQSMGTDDCWYLSLEDVFRESLAWCGSNPPNREVE